MIYLENVALDAPHVHHLSDCELKILKGSVSNETIGEVISRPGIYQVVVELRAPRRDSGEVGPLIAVCKAFAIQWNEVVDEINELKAGWGGSDDINFKDALSEVAPSLRELSQLFTADGRLEAERLAATRVEPEVWQRRAPMGTDEEEGRLQNIALLDYILVSERNRGRGLGKKLVDVLKEKLNKTYRTSHILSFPTALNLSRPAYQDDSSDEEGEQSRWTREQRSSIRFHRELGFRRLFGTKFFCYTYESEHAARKMTVAEDERRDRFLGF